MQPWRDRNRQQSARKHRTASRRVGGVARAWWAGAEGDLGRTKKCQVIERGRAREGLEGTKKDRPTPSEVWKKKNTRAGDLRVELFSSLVCARPSCPSFVRRFLEHCPAGQVLLPLLSARLLQQCPWQRELSRGSRGTHATMFSRSLQWFQRVSQRGWR